MASQNAVRKTSVLAVRPKLSKVNIVGAVSITNIKYFNK